MAWFGWSRAISVAVRAQWWIGCSASLTYSDYDRQGLYIVLLSDNKLSLYKCLAAHYNGIDISQQRCVWCVVVALAQVAILFLAIARLTSD
jgi:hypothetical protein